MRQIQMLGTLADLYFRGVDNPKGALTVREITKVIEQLGSIPADNMRRIEFAGQTIDSFEMIKESYVPLGASKHGPIAAFASLLVNATISFAGTEVEASNLIKAMKDGSISDADVTGIFLSIDPSIEHIDHTTVVGVIKSVTDHLPWLARRGLSMVDQFIAGMFGEQNPQSADFDENVPDDIEDNSEYSSRVAKFI